MILGVIPARGGSKGVLRKNIQPLAGHPLIAYSIRQAGRCTFIDRAVVSTEDEEVAGIARSYGAEVPFLRPAHLAQDGTPMLPVLQHALAWVEERGWGKVRLVVVLQPTCPFRADEDIADCVRTLDGTGADSVIAVCEPSHDPYRLLYNMDDSGIITPLIPRQPTWTTTSGAGRAFGSRQESPQTWCENGAVYVVRRDVVMDQGLIITSNTRGVIVPEERSLDIDSPLDLEFARWLMQRGRSKLPK